MIIKEKIKMIAKKKDINLTTIEHALNLSRTYISKINDDTVDFKKIYKISEYLDIDFDYVVGNSKTTICKTCGCSYDPLDKYSDFMHEYSHNRFVKAKDKWPFLISANNIITTKQLSLYEFENNIDDQIKLESYEKYLQAEFSDYLIKNDFKININYDNFCENEVSKLNNQHPLFNELAQKYKVDVKYLSNSQFLLAKAANDNNLLLVLKYASMLTPDQQQNIIIQLKALSELNNG